MTDEDPGDRCEGSGCKGKGTETTEVQLSIDAVLELLADWRRRELLARLIRSPTQTTIDQLIEHLAERETEARNERPARDSIEIKLLHVHLPKLAEAGIVEYDERSRQVRYRRNDRLERWLERVQDVSED